MAVAALMKKYPGPGGLYLWTREDFGPWHGFLSFWTYWFSIALTLPGSAMFAMSVSAYTFGPRFAYLADNRAYVLISSLLGIWIALGTNMVGMKVGKWTENAGGFTSWMVAALLVGAAALVWRTHGSVTPMNIWPVWNWDTLSLFGGIAYALSGMELLGMMSSDIRSPGAHRGSRHLDRHDLCHRILHLDHGLSAGPGDTRKSPDHAWFGRRRATSHKKLWVGSGSPR